MNNLLIAQSGGPTAAINATVTGILSLALIHDQVDTIYGAIYGVKGLLEENIINISQKIKNTVDLDQLTQTPASALGSCRYKLPEETEDAQVYEKIIEILRRYEIRYFIYIGGNDSMDTVDKLNRYCDKNGITDITVVGAPKTIDNDLVVTDHCPGFGSAAKYIATSFAEIERDCNVYDGKSVTIVEVMGRNSGWLTAASALSRINGGSGPDLIYLCERAFSMETFLNDVKEVLKKQSAVLVAVSEGIKDSDKKYIFERGQIAAKDAFGHTTLSGAAKVLETVIQQEIGCKVRSIELSVMQRCSAHITSATDIEESKLLGSKALLNALEKKGGTMAAIIRQSSRPYNVSYEAVPVSEICNKEKKVPKEYINEAGNDVTEEMMEYLKPLIQGENAVVYRKGIPTYFVF